MVARQPLRKKPGQSVTYASSLISASVLGGAIRGAAPAEVGMSLEAGQPLGGQASARSVIYDMRHTRPKKYSCVEMCCSLQRYAFSPWLRRWRPWRQIREVLLHTAAPHHQHAPSAG